MGCYIFIGCYTIGSYPFFTIIDFINKRKCFDINRLIGNNPNLPAYLEIFNYYKNHHKTSVISQGIPGEIEMEQLFLTKIEALKRYFPNLLLGKIDEYEKYFDEPMRDVDINYYKGILDGAESIDTVK